MSGERRRGGGPIAAAPAAFIVVVEGLTWALAAILDSTGPARVGVWAFCIAAVAGVVAPVAIVATRREDRWMWAVVSVCLTVIGLGLGAAFWFLAALIHCNGECLG